MNDTESTNGVRSPVSSIGCHPLPHIPTMSRKVSKIARSKRGSRCEEDGEDQSETAVLHVDGSDKVVRITADVLPEAGDVLLAAGSSQEQIVSSVNFNQLSEQDSLTGNLLKAPATESLVSVVLDGKTSTKKCEAADNLFSDGASCVSNKGIGSSFRNSSCVVDAVKSTLAIEYAQGDTLLMPLQASIGNTAKSIGSEVSEVVVGMTSSATSDSSEHLPQTGASSMSKDAAVSGSQTVDNSLFAADAIILTGNSTFNGEVDPAIGEELVLKGNGSKKALVTVAHNDERDDAISGQASNGALLAHSDVISEMVSATRTPEASQMVDTLKMYHSSAGRILPRTVLLRESERPSDGHLARLLEGKRNEFDESHPVKYHIGDLLWSHVTGHPYWPGMISSDPFSGLFTSIRSTNRVSRFYHLQYFGDEAERGWVSETSSMLFEGRKKLANQGEILISVTKDRIRRTKLIQAYRPNERRKTNWDLAVDEAEDATTLEKKERIDKYTFVYEFLPNKKEVKTETPKGRHQACDPALGVNRKCDFVDSVLSGPQRPPTKRSCLPDMQPSAQRPIRCKDEGSFETYCIKHREDVREEHPGYTGGMVIQVLKQQWSVMNPLQRLRYRSKFASRTSERPLDSDWLEQPSASRSGTGVTRRTPRGRRLSLVNSQADGHSSGDVEGRLTPSALQFDGGQEVRYSLKRKRKLASDGNNDSSSLSVVGVKARASNDSDSDIQQEEGRLKRPKLLRTGDDQSYVLEIFKLNNVHPARTENLCVVCEKTCADLLKCHGSCLNWFHPGCIEFNGSPDGFKCQECVSGKHRCFSCGSSHGNTRRCSVSQCGKFYHEECVCELRNVRLDGKAFVCPRHVCTTCASDSSTSSRSTRGRLFRCVRCPVAYHAGDFCVAAGSLHLGGCHIVCTEHFRPNKSNSHHQRINVSWCFCCSEGGSLVCCETCPGAFHVDCVHLSGMPEGAWYCPDCDSGKKPLYGEIIWIKIGHYRWWPAEVCHPRNVPANIQDMPHSVGEFPARFFGSHDYYWTNQARVFSFQEGDRGSKESASRGLFKIYYKGVNEAAEAFKLWKSVKDSKQQTLLEKNERRPAPFKFVKINVPVGSVLTKSLLSEIPRCECRPDQKNACGSDTECLNRMLMYECLAATCPAQDACQNQHFQRRQYPESVPFRTESRGWGLKTLVDIKKGQFVNEYVGDLIDDDECRRRIKQAHQDHVTNFYMLTVDKNRVIDAGPRGNHSRFMNHSCEPNLETQKWTVNGEVRVGLFTVVDVAADSELTFNYNLECRGSEKTACVCGSKNCSGFLGVRPKVQPSATVHRKRKDILLKKKRKLPEVKEYEDECFRCGEGGQVVMCDKPSCLKVYHLHCLSLAKAPTGRWLCPWHHCDVCGKLASKLCSECPNSFCAQHHDGLISVVHGKLICAEHTDLIEMLALSTTDAHSVSSGDSDRDSGGSVAGVGLTAGFARGEGEGARLLSDLPSSQPAGDAQLGDGVSAGSCSTGDLDQAGGMAVQCETGIAGQYCDGSEKGSSDLGDATYCGDGAEKVGSLGQVPSTPCSTRARNKSKVNPGGGNRTPSHVDDGFGGADCSHDDSDSDSHSLVIDLLQ